MNKLSSLAAALLLAGAVGLAQAQALRPEVGKPLQQAYDLIKAGKGKEALAKVREADNAANKTAAETLQIERMRAAAAQRAGDNATAIQALEAVYGKVSGGEQGQIAEQIAGAYAASRDNNRAAQWAQKAAAAGNNSASLKQLQAYLQGATGDYAAVAKESAAEVAASERAGKRPDEADLLRLADALRRLNDNAGHAAVLEKLLFNYPKKDYWAIYLDRLARKSGFSDRLSLDLLRLRLATGTLDKADEYMEMSQLALQARLPAEGKAIVDKGFAAGVLGKGAEAERHKRLRDLAVKREAEAKDTIDQRAAGAAAEADGNELVQIGYAYVTMGQADKGIKLIEQGIAKGKLKRAEDAKLHLGLALLQGGKNKARALQVLRSVQGNDGLSDLGKLWALYAGTQG